MSKIVAASCVGLALLWSVGAASATAAIFSVNSTGDDGDQTPGDGNCFTGTLILVGPLQFVQECTLRAAAEESNALAGPDAVAFDSIPLNIGSFAVIALGTNLPSLTDTIDIDGTTAPGYDVGDISANPVVQIDSSGALSWAFVCCLRSSVFGCRGSAGRWRRCMNPGQVRRFVFAPDSPKSTESSNPTCSAI